MRQKITRQRTKLTGTNSWKLGPDRPDRDPHHVVHASAVAPDARHAVYFITTGDMQLLYVGQTRHLLERLRQHAADKDWFTPDCRIFVEWFRDPDAARLREANAIWTSRPSHNRMIVEPHGPSPDPDVPLRPLLDLERDVAATCANCGRNQPHRAGLCAACHQYRHRYGVNRPAHLYAG